MGTIGTVLTPQMKEQTIYVSDDGERFDNAEDCQLWERLADKYKAVKNVTLMGARDEEDGETEGFPPLAVQQFMDIRFDKDDLGRTLGDELFGWKQSSADFLTFAKDLKTFSDWLWS